MIRRIFGLWLMLFFQMVAFAASTNLFDVTKTGVSLAQTVSFTLCLDINGQYPLSCQNYTTQNTVLTIHTTIPNHIYHHAGIRVNTTGYTYSPGTPTNFGYVPLGDISEIQSISGRITPITKLIVTPGGDGHETIDPSTPQSVDYGGTQSFTVAPNTGYMLSNIVGGSCSAGSWSGIIYTTGFITSDCSVIFSASQVFRVAVGYDGNNAPLSYTSTDGGTNWTASTTQPSGFGTLYSVSCSSDGSTCAAVGNDGSAPLSYTSTDSGVTWVPSTTQAPVNGSGSGYLYGVACSSMGSICATVGFDGANAPLSYTSTDGGVDWIASVTQPHVNASGKGYLGGVACSSNGSICVAVGYDGSDAPLSYTSTDGGVVWIASATQPPVNLSNWGHLRGVSCSSNGSICVSVGYDGAGVPLSYTSTDGGVTWAFSTTQPLVNGTGAGYLTSVSCSSNGSTCVVVGSDGNSAPLSYTSTDGGVIWAPSTTQPPVNGSGSGSLSGVACSSTGSICAAVGSDGANVPLSYTSTDGGVTWALSTTQPPVNGSGSGNLYGIG